MVCTADNAIDEDPEEAGWLAGRHDDDGGFVELSACGGSEIAVPGGGQASQSPFR